MTKEYEDKLDQITEQVIKAADDLAVNHHELAKQIVANMKANY